MQQIRVLNYTSINSNTVYTNLNNADYWFLSISPEGIGFVGMIINFVVAIVVSAYTKAPPKEVIEMIEIIRQP